MADLFNNLTQQPKNEILRLHFFGKLLVPFLVFGNLMVPSPQKKMREPHEKMSITASVAAT
jgi:hypothetical protein